MARVYCLDCEEKIILNPHLKVGLKFICPHCDAEMQVLSVDPIEIDWADDDAWDDDYDDEDDW